MMLRSFFWMLGILFVILILQTTVLTYVSLWAVTPNLLLLLFVILSIQNGSIPALICGFIIGIPIDILAGNPVGYHSLLLTIFGYIFGLGKGKIFFDPLFIPAMMSLVVTFFYTVGLFLISTLFNLSKPFASFFNTSFMIELAYNVVAAPILYFVYNFIRQKMQNSRRGFDG